MIFSGAKKAPIQHIVRDNVSTRLSTNYWTNRNYKDGWATVMKNLVEQFGHCVQIYGRFKERQTETILATQIFLSMFCAPTRVALHKKYSKYLLSWLRAEISYRRVCNFDGVKKDTYFGWYKLRNNLCKWIHDQNAAPETNKYQLVSRIKRVRLILANQFTTLTRHINITRIFSDKLLWFSPRSAFALN